MEKDVNLRFLRQEDTEAIRKYESTLTDGKMCLRSSVSDIRACIDGGCSVGLINEDGKLVAFSLAKWNEYGIGYIEKCFVAEEYRGLGYQQRMLSKNLPAMTSRGVHEVWAMASPLNIASLKSFEKQGFTQFKKTMCEGYERQLLKFVPCE